MLEFFMCFCTSLNQEYLVFLKATNPQSLIKQIIMEEEKNRKFEKTEELGKEAHQIMPRYPELFF